MKNTTLEWTYSRNQRRHVAYDQHGNEMFWIVSMAPYRSIQGKHGYRLMYPDIGNILYPNIGHIQFSKSVKLLKGVANEVARTSL